MEDIADNFEVDAGGCELCDYCVHADKEYSKAPCASCTHNPDNY